jgi:hypothetical protein
MPFEVTTSAIGLKDTNKALKNMADERGKKWKRDAMMKSGFESFQHAVKKAKSNAPVGETGLTRRSITSTRGYYNKNVKVYKSGRITKKSRNEYTIGTTLKNTFNSRAPKNRKGQAVRYPFMNEVGVKAQTYVRISSKGNIHTVNRKAARKPLLFQHRALGQTANRVVSTWNRKFSFFIGLYAKSTYASLKSAHSAFIRAGGKIQSGKGKWK